MAGGMVPPRDEVILLNRRKEAAARSLQASAKRIEDFGVQVKDLDTG